MLPEAKKIINAELQRLTAAGVPVRRYEDDETAVQRGLIGLLFEKGNDAKLRSTF